MVQAKLVADLEEARVRVSVRLALVHLVAVVRVRIRVGNIDVLMRAGAYTIR